MRPGKYLFSVVLLLFISTSSYAQLKNTPNDSDEVFRIVEVMPSFPGGNDMMMAFLKTITVYPDSARLNNIEGTVYVSFIVGKDGHLSDIYLVRGKNKFLDAEALRVVRLMPAWIPGRQNDKNVRVQFTLPIKFTLK